jgi:hypothetical protein
MKGPRRARMPVYRAGSKYLGRTEKETGWLRFHAPQPSAIPIAPLHPPAIPIAPLQLRRDTLVQTLGNLTIVTGKLNSGMGNRPWERKRKAVSAYSSLWLNSEIIKNEEWNEEAIEARGNAICTMACEIWPRPGIQAVQTELHDEAEMNEGEDLTDDEENETADDVAQS